MRRAKEGLKNLGGDKEKMNKSLKRKGTALFVVVLLFMTVMLVPAVSAQEQDDTRAKVPSYIKVYSLVELNTTEILERKNENKFETKRDCTIRSGTIHGDDACTSGKCPG